MTEWGAREPTEPWQWSGPALTVTGPTWGGCLEAIERVVTAGRGPQAPDDLAGAVMLLKTSEELLPARQVGWIVRALGERGMLAAVDAVLLARPPVSNFDRRPPPDERARSRHDQASVVIDIVGRYYPKAVVCTGVPFGHTRPQWILPHGGLMTINGRRRKVIAHYG
jgi:muramoyltetrapeptide carboxypeptidase LdcA involved in peptidoglycan recycling